MMSRELKLALILGFAAVMVVGVLISDHMSGARNARIEERTLQAPQLALAPPVTPSGGGYGAIPEPANDQQIVQVLPDNTPALVEQPVAPQQDAPVEIAMGEAPSDAATDAGEARTSAFNDFLAWSEKQGVRFEEIRPTTALIETETRRSSAQTPTEPLPNRPVTGGAPAAEITHTVREGETLWAIAEQHYGDGALYARIEEANKGRMGKSGALYVGAKLVIPGASNAVRQAAAPPTRAPEPSSTKSATKQAPKGDRVHVVKKGETLGDIAKAQLGSARRWPEIVKLNQSVIRDPDNVPAGVRLRLPEN